VPESVVVRPEIKTDEQILAALKSTGAGFEAAGGSAQMLTEAVENGVDSVIQARNAGIRTEGRIRVVIDRDRSAIEVHDDGWGFRDPVHIARKPFESLKRNETDLTGKFARGIQGFRSFCERLTFYTRRPSVPVAETLPLNGASGLSVRIGFEDAKVEVELTVVPDHEFANRAAFATGAIAVYSNWKKGEFVRLRKDQLLTRLTYHFGELIRRGGFRIEVVDGEAVAEVLPRDYSQYKRIEIPPVDVRDEQGAAVIGQVVPELYLIERHRRDPWLSPYLLYKDRPVGDRAIYEIEEVEDAGPWASSFITGFIRCDFCEINELRQALTPGHARNALYAEIDRMQQLLSSVIGTHQRALFEVRMQNQINDLVVELQDFLRSKKIFTFKIARAAGVLSTGEKPIEVHVSAAAGSSEETAALSPGGVPATVLQGTDVAPASVVPPTGGEGDAMARQTDFGGTGAGGGGERGGGPDRPGTAATEPEGAPGYSPSEDALKKAEESEADVSDGADSPALGRKKARRRRPRGFGIKLLDDEFNDDLSTYETTTSTIIINSGHPRFKSREGEEAGRVKDLMEYIGELYIWEITQLAGPQLQLSSEEVSELFLKTKFEFFDQRALG
jgi:hypothetical protein